MKSQKGFTIIELIVVISIIAVLAAIVLVNVTQYINKGRDAAAKGNLSTLLTNGAIFLDTTVANGGGGGTYDGWTSNTTLYGTVVSALTSAGYTSFTANCDTASCAATATKWCAAIQEKTIATYYYCVDSSGNKVEAEGTYSDHCVDACL